VCGYVGATAGIRRKFVSVISSPDLRRGVGKKSQELRTSTRSLGKLGMTECRIADKCCGCGPLSFAGGHGGTRGRNYYAADRD
jgi:hypothetical protein